MNPARVTVAPLREYPEHCAFFEQAFSAEWPSWYGPDGPGDARSDLEAFANEGGTLPVGVVAFASGGQPVGVAALKEASIPSHAHLSPWAAAGYVVPQWRRQGVGALLLAALVREASRLGYQAIFCATETSQSLLIRQGWIPMEPIVHEGGLLQLFCYAMPPSLARPER